MTSRERCPICSAGKVMDPALMVRAYIRPGAAPGEKRSFIPIGWYCPICHNFLRD